MFPEGTFRADPTPLPYHLGGFLAAVQAGVPVLPLVLCGTREMLPDGSHWPRRTELVLHIEEPIEPPQAADAMHAAVALRDETRSVILRRLFAEG